MREIIPGKLAKRTEQFLLLATFVPLCWLLMQVVHELGHVIAALATGGAVERVVLRPLTISRTDASGSSHPLLVVWAGPIFGVVVPLALWVVVKAAKWRWNYMVRFFAGFCLIANGAYIGIGSFQKIGDAGDILRLGSPLWTLWLFGIVAIPFGLFLWNGLGPRFGLGRAAGEVDRGATFLSCVLLLMVVIVEMLCCQPLAPSP